MDPSDFQLNARVRSVLARHWIDLSKISFGTFRGTVRFSGEIRHLGERDFDPAQLDTVDYEVRSIQGVKRTYFDLTNWHRCETGEWRTTAKATMSQDRGESVTLIVGTKSADGRTNGEAGPHQEKKGDKR